MKVRIKTAAEFDIEEGKTPNGWNIEGKMNHLIGQTVEVPADYKTGYFMVGSWTLDQDDIAEYVDNKENTILFTFDDLGDRLKSDMAARNVNGQMLLHAAAHILEAIYAQVPRKVADAMIEDLMNETTKED